MGASMHIDFFGVYRSKADVESAFKAADEFAKEVDFVGLQKDAFLTLNDNYVLFNAGASMPYSDCTTVGSYLSVLSENSLYYQYGLKSEELEMDELYTYDIDETRDAVRLVSSHQHKTDLSPYFQFPETRKVFGNDRGVAFHIDTRKLVIDHQEYSYFENVPKPDVFYGSLLLDDLLISVENKEVIAIYAYYKEKIIANRKLQNVYKELFIADDRSEDNLTFIYGVEQFWTYCLQYEGKEQVIIDDKVYEDCLVIKHCELELDNTFELKATGIKHSLQATEDFYRTYWAKGVGLVRILANNPKGQVIYNCTAIRDDFSEAMAQKDSMAGLENPVKKNWWNFWK